MMTTSYGNVNDIQTGGKINKTATVENLSLFHLKAGIKFRKIGEQGPFCFLSPRVDMRPAMHCFNLCPENNFKKRSFIRNFCI